MDCLASVRGVGGLGQNGRDQLGKLGGIIERVGDALVLLDKGRQGPIAS
jgi:hypothetical protein